MSRRALPPALGAAAGIVLDRVLPEPPGPVHPVAVFGLVMTGLEQRVYRDDRRAGVAHALVGVALGVGAGRAVRSTLLATTTAVAGRGLADAAEQVGRALDDADLDRARRLLPALVGRDPHDLDGAEIARAVVESVAENTVDAVVGPAFWAGLVGAPGALGYRAVNTLDSMVGHRSARYANFGWASARLDDALAWVPARLTAVLVAAVRPRAAGAVWRAVRTQAPGHPSPNAGVAEAAFAAALGVRLGGTNRYDGYSEARVALGTGRVVTVGDIERAVRLSRDVSAALAAGLALVGSTLALGRRGRRQPRASHRPEAT
jgi:adenosylcobinamide-phosphate synthase